MAGIFPDSGVPANQALNSVVVPTTGCDATPWHSTNRCQPRFDPAAANAVMAEILNVTACAGLPYDCDQLDNLCTSITQLIKNTVTDGCGFEFPDDPVDLCAIRPLAVATDAEGCTRIVAYSPSNVVGCASSTSVYGEGHNETIPADPANDAAYYSRAELSADVVSDSINEGRLNNTKVLDFDVTVECAGLYYLDSTNPTGTPNNPTINLAPNQNSGNGAAGMMVLRIGPDFLLTPGNLVTPVFGHSTNFMTRTYGGAAFTLAAGTTRIRLYWIHDSAAASQMPQLILSDTNNIFCVRVQPT